MTQNRVVILTGAAGGFGAVFSRAFIAAGWRIAALDVKGALLGRFRAGRASWFSTPECVQRQSPGR